MTGRRTTAMGIEQLREIIERLAADPSSVTSEELAAARSFIAEQRSHLAEQNPSADVITALTELRDHRAAITVVQDQRAAETAELDEQRRGLLDELNDPPAPAAAEPDPTTETAPVEPVAEQVQSTEVPAAPDAPVSVTVPDQPAQELPVAASAQVARRAPIGMFRTQQPAVPARQDTQLVARGVVTAAGSSAHFQQGQELRSTAELALAMTDRLRSMSTGRAGGGSEKVYVANVAHEYPESRILRAKDWVGNFSKIEAATGDNALVAAGGLCAPLQVLYDVDTIGSSARPIRDALARFQVDRGGIQYRPHTSAASALTDGEGTGVDKWSMDQDASGVDTKGCFEVDCPAIEEAEVWAVYLCLKFSNITARFDPETTASYVRQGVIAHARKAENELLRALQAGSKVLSSPKVIGAVRDILANLDKATAYYRNRHRIDTDISLTCILPAWVRYLMRTDLARQMAAGDWMEALGLTDAQIATWFRARGVMPVWHLDGGIGGVNEVQTVTITGTPTGGTYTLTFDGETTAAIDFDATAAEVLAALRELPNIDYGDVVTAGGPHPGTAITVAFGGGYEHTNVPQMTATGSFTGGTTPAIAVTTTTASSLTSVVNGVSIASQVYAEAAAGAAIPGYPDQIDALLFPSGSQLYLDGGNLDLGLVRDSTLNSQNKYQQFSETFEGVANRAVEPLRLAMTVQPTGQTAGTADTSAIAD